MERMGLTTGYGGLSFDNHHIVADTDLYNTSLCCKYDAFLSNPVQHTLLRLFLKYFVCY